MSQNLRAVGEKEARGATTPANSSPNMNSVPRVPLDMWDIKS